MQWFFNSTEARGDIGRCSVSISCQSFSSTSCTTEVNETIPNEEEKADERYEKVIALIDTLPTMQQTIMRLRHMEGMEINDIAKLTGSKETAVRKALSRARHAIKNQFLKTEWE